ncbi:MAG: 6,7-dimethyl-8-ribityllumazine synthase [Flavobacteriales bacterium]|nr:6,7-dimethyl-8-ribityllumazine synthase [Flavobacteriales bacterium]
MATSGKNLSNYSKEKLYVPKGKRIGICYSEWNEEITLALLDGAEEVLRQVMREADIIVKSVPGSFELALGAQFLFEAEKADAVICIGSVIRGETAHFDFVCSAASQGIQEVGLKYNAPCIFCVLTDDNIQQSRARSGGEHGNKGTEAALVALSMLKLKSELGL